MNVPAPGSSEATRALTTASSFVVNPAETHGVVPVLAGEGTQR